MQGRCRGDAGEVQGRYSGPVVPRAQVRVDAEGLAQLLGQPLAGAVRVCVGHERGVRSPTWSDYSSPTPGLAHAS